MVIKHVRGARSDCFEQSDFPSFSSKPEILVLCRGSYRPEVDPTFLITRVSLPLHVTFAAENVLLWKDETLCIVAVKFNTYTVTSGSGSSKILAKNLG